MVLIDTSVWVDHLRRADQALMHLLEDAQVASHPLVIGELACGNISNRKEVLSLLDALPKAKAADDDEVLELIARHRLHGQGLGYIDCCLLASCLLSSTALWTKDRRLGMAARRIEIIHG